MLLGFSERVVKRRAACVAVVAASAALSVFGGGRDLRDEFRSPQGAVPG